MIVVVVIVVVVVLGIAGLGLLYALGAGANGPVRFKTKPVDDVVAFVESGASWAVTGEVSVPAAADEVWNRLQRGNYVGVPLLFSGPEISGDTHDFRGLVSVRMQVVQSEPNIAVSAVAVGASIPFVRSAAERVVISPGRDGSVVSVSYAFSPILVGFLPLRWTAFVARPFVTGRLRRALA